MSWTHFSDIHPRARKVHRCDLCGLKIRPGTTYLVRSGLRDGTVIVSRMHRDCEAASRDWTERDWECAPDGPSFRQTIDEQIERERNDG